MGSTRYSSKRLRAPLACLLGAWLSGTAARAQDADAGTEPPAAAPSSAPSALQPPAPPPVEEVTHCGDKQVGSEAGQLQPLGQGFYADGGRVRRGCTLLLQRPVRNRPPVPFAPDSFRPIGCGFFRYATSVYWAQPLGEDDHAPEPGGARADVLTRLDLADAQTFEVDADCRPRDARFFYLNHTAHPELPSFVAVPRGDGQGYEELGCGFVRYEGRIFFGTRLVEGAHAPSFNAVLGRLPYAECGLGLYGRDRLKVWWRSEPVRGAKARTFRVPREENANFLVACDGKRSFQQGNPDKKPLPLCGGKKPVVKKRK